MRKNNYRYGQAGVGCKYISPHPLHQPSHNLGRWSWSHREKECRWGRKTPGEVREGRTSKQAEAVSIELGKGAEHGLKVPDQEGTGR